MDDMGENKHDGLQLMNLLYAIAEDQAVKGIPYFWYIDMGCKGA
jgi:hypothetical protein